MTKQRRDGRRRRVASRLAQRSDLLDGVCRLGSAVAGTNPYSEALGEDCRGVPCRGTAPRACGSSSRAAWTNCWRRATPCRTACRCAVSVLCVCTLSNTHRVQPHGTYTRAHTHTHKHTHAHTYTRTHAHTHTRAHTRTHNHQAPYGEVSSCLP